FYCKAEDGIRDFHVTGVQTCALPISPTGAKMGRRLFSKERRAKKSDGTILARAAVGKSIKNVVALNIYQINEDRGQKAMIEPAEDRKSVVEGNRVDHGGRSKSNLEKS